ncbi:MAG: coproporphyrinogen dehydrogenase HemZ [Clostridioides sp.]|jgi:oxygen-independent coproporphyrinogen-3 oxidase|nr:coproporphyrinogen dehydrogenase HemZ [Clostridioides sp.]
MFFIEINGHDYKYEVSELIKMFTNEFKFVEQSSDDFLNIEDFKEGDILLENILEVSETNIISTIYIKKNIKNEQTNKKINSDELICVDEIVEVADIVESVPMKKQCKEDIKRSFYKALNKLCNSYVPWGILTGIRPVKVLHGLITDGCSDERIREILRKQYLISDEKIDLALEVAKRECKFIYPLNKDKISLYISIPFCPTRCLYCSFPSNSLEKYGHMKKLYLEKLTQEIKGVAKIIEETDKTIETLYIGGGTPTSLDACELEYLINTLYNELDISNILEFTVEAGRPDTITLEKLQTLKKLGVTRISINPQTMNNETLKKIGREHTVSDIVDKFHMAREVGFDNINMDIILGLIDEDIEMVRNTLEQIKLLSPESLTVHTMAIKRASELNRNMQDYKSKLKKDEEIIQMIDLSMKYADEMGLKPYYMYRQKHMVGNLENIGYSKEGYECIYNIQVMEEKQSNFALGAGSISKFVYLDENRIERVPNVKNLEQYIDRVDEMIQRKQEEVNKNA